VGSVAAVLAANGPELSARPLNLTSVPRQARVSAPSEAAAWPGRRGVWAKTFALGSHPAAAKVSQPLRTRWRAGRRT